MGQMIDVYYDCYKIQKNKNIINQAGFYVSDFKHYNKFIKKNKNFAKFPHLFEWNLTNLKLHSKIEINEKIINYYEKKYFLENSIWEAFTSDRRIYHGSKSKYSQDYNTSYNYEDLIKLAIISIKKIEEFLELVKPKYIIGFTTATFGEYLFYLISKKYGIKFIQLRHTKILNNYTFCSDMHEGYEKIRNDFNNNNLLFKKDIMSILFKNIEAIMIKIIKTPNIIFFLFFTF